MRGPVDGTSSETVKGSDVCVCCPCVHTVTDVRVAPVYIEGRGLQEDKRKITRVRRPAVGATSAWVLRNWRLPGP